jgi:hypothetical protein
MPRHSAVRRRRRTERVRRAPRRPDRETTRDVGSRIHGVHAFPPTRLPRARLPPKPRSPDSEASPHPGRPWQGSVRLDLGGTVFFDVELDETAGVEIEDQRRSSRTMAEALFPRVRGRRREPAGLPPLHSAAPASTSSQARFADVLSSRGISRATDRPCSVITILSPPRALRR